MEVQCRCSNASEPQTGHRMRLPFLVTAMALPDRRISEQTVVIDLPTVYVGHIEEFALARDVLTCREPLGRRGG